MIWSEASLFVQNLVIVGEIAFLLVLWKWQKRASAVFLLTVRFNGGKQEWKCNVNVTTVNCDFQAFDFFSPWLHSSSIFHIFTQKPSEA